MVETLCDDKDVVPVVDDEEMVVQQTVERHGCQTASFNNPGEALQYYRENSQKITLMITDLTTPVLPGSDLIRHPPNSSSAPGYSPGDALQEVMLYSPLPLFGDAVNAL